jgi:hypothetical protein
VFYLRVTCEMNKFEGDDVGAVEYFGSESTERVIYIVTCKSDYRRGLDW